MNFSQLHDLVLAPKRKKIHVNFPLDCEALKQVGGEEVDKGGVFGLIIDLEIPPILVTLDSEFNTIHDKFL